MSIGVKLIRIANAITALEARSLLPPKDSPKSKKPKDKPQGDQKPDLNKKMKEALSDLQAKLKAAQKRERDADSKEGKVKAKNEVQHWRGKMRDMQYRLRERT